MADERAESENFCDQCRCCPARPCVLSVLDPVHTSFARFACAALAGGDWQQPGQARTYIHMYVGTQRKTSRRKYNLWQFGRYPGNSDLYPDCGTCFDFSQCLGEGNGSGMFICTQTDMPPVEDERKDARSSGSSRMGSSTRTTNKARAGAGAKAGTEGGAVCANVVRAINHTIS